MTTTEEGELPGEAARREQAEAERRERFRAGLRAGFGFGAAAFVVGISFGVVSEPLMGSFAPVVMSALVFAGASQFGSTSVLLSGGGAATAIATGAMLNARFLPMGVAAAPALRGSRWRRALEGQAVVDASWALAARGEDGFDRETMMGGTIPQYPGWVLGTLIGVIFGGALGNPEDLGLDAIFPAFFLGLLASELRRPHAVPAVLIGGAIALALTPVLPPGLPVLLASSAALIGLRRR
jgi:predicted branched-subunit amino acid permease